MGWISIILDWDGQSVIKMKRSCIVSSGFRKLRCTQDDHARIQPSIWRPQCGCVRGGSSSCLLLSFWRHKPLVVQALRKSSELLSDRAVRMRVMGPIDWLITDPHQWECVPVLLGGIIAAWGWVSRIPALILLPEEKKNPKHIDLGRWWKGSRSLHRSPSKPWHWTAARAHICQTLSAAHFCTVFSPVCARAAGSLRILLSLRHFLFYVAAGLSHCWQVPIMWCATRVFALEQVDRKCRIQQKKKRVNTRARGGLCKLIW